MYTFDHPYHLALCLTVIIAIQASKAILYPSYVCSSFGHQMTEKRDLYVKSQQ